MVSYEGKNVTLEDAFAAVERQTGYLFLYAEHTLNGTAPVTLKAENMPLLRFLDSLFKDQPLKYTIESKTITVSRRPVARLMAVAVLSTPIKARIVSDKGIPLPGASVFVKSAKRVTTSSDAEGRFTVEANEGDVLTITFVGYETKSIHITADVMEKARQGEWLSISLTAGTSPLDEVQVIAYGQTSKRLNTGNVTTVRSEDIEKQPVSNPLQALQGRVPGLIISQYTGMPGGGFSVQIRGQNSLRSSNPSQGAYPNDPLYVIDGVPYSSQMMDGLWGPAIGSGNPLNFISTSDIESIDVLKDADATAIYGSRGANGIILITTKKGAMGAMKVTLNAYHGIGKVPRRLNLLNTEQYLEMRREAFANDGVTPDEFNAPDLTVWDQHKYTDWQKVLTSGAADMTNAQLSFSGGTTNTQYLFGLSYQRQTTVFPGDGGANQKAAGHFNITGTSNNKRFKATFNGNYMLDYIDLLGRDLIEDIMLPPNAPDPFNEDGTLNWAPSANRVSTWNNPFSTLLQKYYTTTNNLVANTLLSYEIIHGLEIKATLGYNFLQQRQNSTSPVAALDPAFYITTGSSAFTNSTVGTWNVEPQLMYERNIGKGRFSALIGTTFQEKTASAYTLIAQGFTSDAFLRDINAAATITRNGGANNGYKYHSIFTRLTYNYEDKYLVNLSGRRDGSDKFGPGNRFGNFGSVGLAWIFSEEPFFEPLTSFFSFGKLRTSYGTTGNDQVNYYQFINTYSPGFTFGIVPYQGVVGILADNFFNPNYSWEVNRKFEAALETGFLKDRLLLSVSHYRNRSGNQLIAYPLPSYVGFSGVVQNSPAVIDNRGWEIQLSTTNINTKNIRWTSSFNISFSKNKLAAFPNFEQSGYSGVFGFMMGQPLSIMQKYKFVDVDPETGLYRFEGPDGKPTSTPPTAYRPALIDPTPDFYGGLSNTFSYKGFSLDVFFQFVKQIGQHYLYNPDFPGPGAMYNNPVTVLDRWQKPGDVATIQRYSQNYDFVGQVVNDLYDGDRLYQDASYIRLKNLALSYTLPDHFVRKTGLAKVRVYAHAQNLLTITGYDGLDPESAGRYMNNLPPLRMMTAGVEIGF